MEVTISSVAAVYDRRFYERGCQDRNTPALTGFVNQRGILTASPRFRLRRDRGQACLRSSSITVTTRRSSETEKQSGRLLPATVLSEPRGLSLFQAVRGRIGFYRALMKHQANRPTDPAPRPCCSERTDTFIIESILCLTDRSERLCCRIQFLRIESLSLLPDSQCNRSDLPSQAQSRHLGANPFLSQALDVTAIRFGSTAARCCPNERFFQPAIPIRI